MAAGSAIQIPSRLPLLLTHEGVLLPGSTMRTSVDSPRNMQLVRSRLLKGTSLRSTIIGVIPNTSDPTSDSDDLPSLHRCRRRALPSRPSATLLPPGPRRCLRAGVALRGAELCSRPGELVCVGRGRRRAGLLLGESENGSRLGRRRDPRKRFGVIRAVPLISDRKSVTLFSESSVEDTVHVK